MRKFLSIIILILSLISCKIQEITQNPPSVGTKEASEILLAAPLLVTLKANPKDRNNWNDCFEWCTDKVELFNQTFKKYTNN